MRLRKLMGGEDRELQLDADDSIYHRHRHRQVSLRSVDAVTFTWIRAAWPWLKRRKSSGPKTIAE
jgi:hypothetical protein